MSSTEPKTRGQKAAAAFKTVHTSIGFQKGYAFILWFIFGGALFGFTLARLHWADINGVMCPEHPLSDGSTGFPAACYWIQHFPRYHIGITLHLSCYLPAGLLVVFQFVPGIRHRFIWWHRIVGYICIILAVLGNAGAAMLADTAMGGEMGFQITLGLVIVGTAFTFAFAIINIRRHQLDGHRAWMIRTWAYIGYIITLRLIQMTTAQIVTRWPEISKHIAIQCGELRYIYFNDLEIGEGWRTQDAWDSFVSSYPSCENDSTVLTEYATVHGQMNLNDVGQANAAFMAVFSASGVLALAINAMVAEIYLWLTPAETERLRRISYERQLKRGYKNPGTAGLVGIGDVNKWTPPVEREEAIATGRSSGSVSDTTAAQSDKDARTEINPSKV